MKITKNKLRRIIKEEKQKLLNEYGASQETGSYLIGFAQAYASLGSAIQEQLNKVVNVYMIGGGFPDELESAIHEQNPAALQEALRKLRGPVSQMQDLEDARDLGNLFEEIEEHLGER